MSDPVMAVVARLARLGDTVKLNDGSVVSVQTWSSAADCLFPARHSRRGRVKT